ncbi:unnamed protein product [Amoebophrya sp. A25]|nr:unnamed protein product [Amoebophrya sp. A25]|eukprot:GSA25T00006168001.1
MAPGLLHFTSTFPWLETTSGSKLRMKISEKSITCCCCTKMSPAKVHRQ